MWRGGTVPRDGRHGHEGHVNRPASSVVPALDRPANVAERGIRPKKRTTDQRRVALLCDSTGTSRGGRWLGWKHCHGGCQVVWPGVGMAPSCCMKPMVSISCQLSTILPLSNRQMLMPVKVTCLPVGGMPWKAP
jgi:hypothetical protein